MNKEEVIKAIEYELKEVYENNHCYPIDLHKIAEQIFKIFSRKDY